MFGYPNSSGFAIPDTYDVIIPTALNVNASNIGSGFGAGVLINSLNIAPNATLSVSSGSITSAFGVTSTTINNGRIEVSSSDNRFAEIELGAQTQGLGIGTYIITGTATSVASVRTNPFSTLDAFVGLEGPNSVIIDYDGNNILSAITNVSATGVLSLQGGTALAHQGELTNDGFIALDEFLPFPVVGSSSLTQTGGFVNHGLVDIQNNAFGTGPGGKISVSGNYLQVGGRTVVVGELQAAEIINSSGSIVLDGKLTGHLENSDLLSIGQVFEGGLGAQADSIELTSTSTLEFSWAGAGVNRYWSRLDVAGLLTLGGNLEIDVPVFDISPTDVFLFATTGSLGGAFANVASGERLFTDDGVSSFVVTYDQGGEITLSDFQQVPEPHSLLLLAAGGLGGFGRRRR